MVVDPNKTNVNEANLSSLARVTPLTSETSDNTETVKTFDDLDARRKSILKDQGNVDITDDTGLIVLARANPNQQVKAKYGIKDSSEPTVTDNPQPSPAPITPPGQPHNKRKHHHFSDKVKKFVNKSANKLKKGVKTVLGIPGQIGGALIAGGVGGAVDSVKSIVGRATKPIVNTAKAIGKRIKKMF